MPRLRPRSVAVATLPLAVAVCEWAGSGPILLGIHQTPDSPSPVIALVQSRLDSLGSQGARPVRIATALDARGEHSSLLDMHVGQATRLRDLPGLVGVVGPTSSSMALAVAPVYRDAGIPFINTLGTSGLIAGTGPWTFSLPATDSQEGRFIADFIVDHLAADSVTLFYVAQPYGIGLRDGVVAGLQARGATLVDQAVVRHSVTCPSGSPNPHAEAVAGSLGRGTPDVVVVAGREYETGCIARALAERGVSVPVIGGDGTASNSLVLSSAGPAGALVYSAAFWHPSSTRPQSRSFVDRFTEAVGTPPTVADALDYDGLSLLADAVRTVGPDRERIRGYLSQLGSDRPAFQGVTGPIAFGSNSTPPLLMVRAEIDSIVATTLDPR